MQPIAILYNIKAGRHRAAVIAEALTALLKVRGIRHEVFGAQWPGDLSIFSSVWVIGGDGTMNFLINHVTGEMPPLALFKGGTGNDLAALLYGDLSIAGQVDRILHATPSPVDAGLCNGRYFVNMCGLGFDGEVLKSMDTIRWMGSSMGYYSAIVKNIFLHREPVLSVSIDGGQEAAAPYLILMASNAPTTGGGFRVSPRARIDDGVLDLITIDRLPILQRLRYLPRVKKGEHLELPFVHHRQVKSIRVTSDQIIKAQLDGELIMAKEFNISILPGKFRFLY